MARERRELTAQSVGMKPLRKTPGHAFAVTRDGGNGLTHSQTRAASLIAPARGLRIVANAPDSLHADREAWATRR